MINLKASLHFFFREVRTVTQKLPSSLKQTLDLTINPELLFFQPLNNSTSFEVSCPSSCKNHKKIKATSICAHVHTHTHTLTHCCGCGLKSVTHFHSLLSEPPSLPGLLFTFSWTGQPGPPGQCFCLECLLSYILCLSYCQELKQNSLLSGSPPGLVLLELQHPLLATSLFGCLCCFDSEDVWLCQFVGS